MRIVWLDEADVAIAPRLTRKPNPFLQTGEMNLELSAVLGGHCLGHSLSMCGLELRWTGAAGNRLLET